MAVSKTLEIGGLSGLNLLYLRNDQTVFIFTFLEVVVHSFNAMILGFYSNLSHYFH
jgi:hypothetical protein